MPTINGTVYDSSGAGAAGRVVRLYRRDSGALLTEVLTGTGQAVPGDPHYDKVSLLLDMDGANGSNVFTDRSQSPSVITAVGSAAITTANAKYGTGALSSNGGRITAPHTSKLDLSTGDWTIELWFWLNATSSEARLIDKEAGNGLYPWAINAGGTVQFRSFNSSGSLLPDLNGATAVTAQAWNHVAVSRAGNVHRLFLAGIQQATSTRSDALRVASDPVNIGNNGLNSAYSGVLVDGVRITKGVARYTANFTPPAAPFYATLEVPAVPIGTYSVDTLYTGEVQRIVLDDDAGTLHNDLLDRVMLA